MCARGAKVYLKVVKECVLMSSAASYEKPIVVLCVFEVEALERSMLGISLREWLYDLASSTCLPYDVMILGM